jgi:hypothetical protein
MDPCGAGKALNFIRMAAHGYRPDAELFSALGDIMAPPVW